MSSKPLFMPAPRPRLTEEEARQLIEGSADLGFGRKTGDASLQPPVKTAPRSPAARMTPAPVKPEKVAPVKAVKPRPKKTDSNQTLRFEVPEDLWTALKLESVHRRVTVRYLLLEALAKAGYPVDIANMPTDGRRLR